MEAKTGRNSPCRCGSGKKYKNCCLRKHQDAKYASHQSRLDASGLEPPPPRPTGPAALPKAPLPAPPPRAPAKRPRPLDPHQAALVARWEAFHAADYEGRIALFLRTLEEKELMDEENSFEMLNELHGPSSEKGERDRFDGLVRALRDRLPDVYAKHAGYFVCNLIENAVATRRFEALPELGRELALLGPHLIDPFHHVLDMLGYHGQLPVMLEIVRLSWPEVRASRDVLGWAVQEFGETAGDYEIFSYLEQAPAPAGDDPVLVERLGDYLEDLRIDKLVEYVEHVTGKRKDGLVLGQFDLGPPPPKKRSGWNDEEDEVYPPAEWQLRLHWLSQEFLGYLRREEGVPYTKGELARSDLVRYLIDRARGELQDRDGAKQPKKATVPGGHPLCPDRLTLDRFLARYFGFLSFRKHRPAALFELLPAWLRFLESRDLLTGEQRQKALEDLRPLSHDLRRAFQTYYNDPSLEAAMRAWDEAPKPSP